MNLRVSFVITARNEDPSKVEATVDGILGTIGEHRSEILVVDDASDERIDCRAAALTIIRNSEPVGVTRARQLGTAAATGDVFVWLDAHMTFAAGWPDVMLRQLRPGSLLCAPWHDYERRRIHAWGSDFRWCEERDYERGLRPGFDFSRRLTRPRASCARVPNDCRRLLHDAVETERVEGSSATPADSTTVTPPCSSRRASPVRPRAARPRS